VDDIHADLDGVRLDWIDFEAAARTSRQILAGICNSKRALSALVASARDDQHLRDKCESHQLLDYLVLYDALDRGLRLRLHLSTSDHLQRVHDHRFDFSSFIICGLYEHCLIEPRKDPYSLSSEENARLYQDKTHPDPAATLTTADFPIAFVRDETGGNTYSFSHTLTHTVLTTKNTVSLVLRGPVRRTRSFIFDRNTETLWWRFGQQDESPLRRDAKRMSDEQFDQTLSTLEALGVIDT
jgi:hypothetical protein